MCVAFEFCVVETCEVFEPGCVVDAVEVEALVDDVDELVVVLDAVESGVVLVVDFIDFAGVVVEIVEIGLLEPGDDPVDVFEVLEGEDLEETVVMRLGSTMLLHKSP